MIKEIKVVTYWSDGGDGGGGVSIYKTLDNLRKDRFNPEDYTHDTKEEADAAYQSALNRDDPYEHGEIGNATIQIEVSDDGSLRLAKDFYVHYGQ